MEFLSDVGGGEDRHRPSFFELAAQGEQPRVRRRRMNYRLMNLYLFLCGRAIEGSLGACRSIRSLCQSLSLDWSSGREGARRETTAEISTAEYRSLRRGIRGICYASSIVTMNSSLSSCSSSNDIISLLGVRSSSPLLSFPLPLRPTSQFIR